eukprot:CAMPEP_0181319172 /NCGR_PEP_ID=MMETSP1101-20121128/17422_1 /TAXON_ID=46948 /ORGANISM="Rhodomonas abbreviata, Strain Caron Lab Isolate" /LENGTH=365 /DNA_ID=CAMNT_0023426739 /DNA_START=451 /DNA_END=1548 /DNA_ORIENTATION=+
MSGGLHGLNISQIDYCEDKDCRFVDEHTIFVSGPSEKSLLVSTYIKEREQKRRCKEDAAVCPHMSPFFTEKEDAFYVAGVEKMQIVVEHEAMAPSFYSSYHNEKFRGGSSEMKGKLVSYRDDGTGRVRTVDLNDIDPTVGLRMTVEEVLDAAGLSLDKKLEGEKHPVRHTGAVINAHLRYSNTHTFLSPSSEMQYTVEFAPALNQGSQLASAYEPVGFGDARMMVKRTGIRIIFLQQGKLGCFSVVAFFQTLAAGFFITATTTWLMGQIVTRYIPLAERYEVAKYEYTENINNIRQSMNLMNDRVLEQGGRSVAAMLQRNDYGAVGQEMPRVAESAVRVESAAISRLASTGSLVAQQPPPMYPQQ